MISPCVKLPRPKTHWLGVPPIAVFPTSFPYPPIPPDRGVYARGVSGLSILFTRVTSCSSESWRSTDSTSISSETSKGSADRSRTGHQSNSQTRPMSGTAIGLPRNGRPGWLTGSKPRPVVVSNAPLNVVEEERTAATDGLRGWNAGEKGWKGWKMGMERWDERRKIRAFKCRASYSCPPRIHEPFFSLNKYLYCSSCCGAKPEESAKKGASQKTSL